MCTTYFVCSVFVSTLRLCLYYVCNVCVCSMFMVALRWRVWCVLQLYYVDSVLTLCVYSVCVLCLRVYYMCTVLACGYIAIELCVCFMYITFALRL